ncbi:MAG: hypothetical protein P9L92_18110 [Candidatus Electryonea clarkiae]|nr:hypothetical protein [Candidatus Electryonea clarkiae]MDP8288187.1 hypothetical protein [Candidatus Electryonea clarkiae]
MYRCATFPQDATLIQDIEVAANILEQKLSNLDVDSLEISDYNKRYLSEHIEHINSYLKRCSFVLAWAFRSSVTPYKDLLFVEYGAGTGGLSLLAKELGVGTVIYNDIYNVSCKDAEIIASSMKIVADDYVCGGLDDVVDNLNTRSVACDAIGSNDVIEHVYDIELFINNLSKVPGKHLTVAFSSAANSLNPMITRRWMSIHKSKENVDQEKKWGEKEIACLRAYKAVRHEMIQAYKPDIEPHALEKLVRNTRGLMEPDIRQCVVEYSETGAFPPEPLHPTNTCDPYTGNWEERMMDQDFLRVEMDRAGFEARILSGYYGGISPVRKAISPVLNVMIKLGGKIGLRIAPFFMLYGIRR